jgi:hypothetical protein
LSSDEEQQMKKIYDDILSSTDSTNKKTGVRALAGYGKKQYRSYKNFVTLK